MIIPASMIVFIFAGNSNMNGHCAKMDLSPMRGVYSIVRDSIFKDSATDADYCEDNNQSGSMVLPFLKCMKKRYPEYRFCGIKMASACARASDRVPGDSYYERFVKRIKPIKGRVVFGGILLDYSLIEGKNAEDSKNLSSNLITLRNNIRREIGNDFAPCLIVRYALNGDTVGAAKKLGYRNCDSIILSQLLIAASDSLSALIPVRHLPGLDYCDNHHPAEAGYEIQAEDGAAIYQQRKFDFWN
jgi:hypothetical protein